MDIVDQATRSRMMAAIAGKNTTLELKIRKALFACGLRYRLHGKALPGRPDLVFPRYRAVVFIHGCFWHGHDCSLFKWPSTRPDFWRAKIDGNRNRDQRQAAALGTDGWRVATIWECSIRGEPQHAVVEVAASIYRWLTGPRTMSYEIRSAKQ